MQTLSRARRRWTRGWFTLLVWQKLQEQNQDLFQASAMRLQLKDQINLSSTTPVSLPVPDTT